MLVAAGQVTGTVYGLGDVGDVPISPEPDLVTEDPKPARPPTADSACRDHATLLATQVRDRRLLDHKPRPGDLDLKRRVVEVARWTPLDPRHQRLVHMTVQPDEAPACTERQPVQVNGRAASWVTESALLWAGCAHTASISSCSGNPWVHAASPFHAFRHSRRRAAYTRPRCCFRLHVTAHVKPAWLALCAIRSTRADRWRACAFASMPQRRGVSDVASAGADERSLFALTRC